MLQAGPTSTSGAPHLHGTWLRGNPHLFSLGLEGFASLGRAYICPCPASVQLSVLSDFLNEGAKSTPTPSPFLQTTLSDVTSAFKTSQCNGPLLQTSSLRLLTTPYVLELFSPRSLGSPGPFLTCDCSSSAPFLVPVSYLDPPVQGAPESVLGFCSNFSVHSS